MTKFIIKILLFLALFLTVWALVFAADFYLIGNQNLGSFDASILDKVERMQAIEEPKIILVGNSNVSLGFDSALLEQATGRPVVNLGLHGGLGNAFLENMVTLGVNEGDLVVICHCDYDDDGTVPDPALAWITVEMHPELWELIPADCVGSMLKAYPSYFFSSLLSWVTGGKRNIPQEGITYSRAGFNAYGDVCIRGEDTFEFTPDSVVVYSVGEATVRRLNALNDYVLSRGAAMVVAGYPIGSGEFTPPAEEYDRFEADLRAQLDFPVISHFTDYMLPYDCFYDTVFHLNDRGCQLRTQQLISDLEEYWAEQ